MILLALFLLFLVMVSPAQAVENPIAVNNNKYGIHVADVNEFDEVSKLVNSHGGDWGYITLVIQENDRNIDKWQAIFDKLRRLHLIPLVRLATQPEEDYWQCPGQDEADEWVDFLASLNWPTQNRYVILFNEPNHSQEWQNQLDPKSYADILVGFSQALKDKSDDFFVLPAGLDFSASTDGKSMNAAEYLRQMILYKPEICQSIDGWTSHSYPNPGFSSSPLKTGRGSLSSYKWELNYFKTLGCSRDLPVFITETGWLHSEGQDKNRRLLTPEQVAKYTQIAADRVWSDPQIAAVTPFIFSYQSSPFDHFSWKVLGASDFYPHYYAYQNIKKTPGQPVQEEKFSVENSLIPDSLVAESVYELSLEIKNTGQSILSESEGYNLVVKPDEFSSLIEVLPVLEPGQTGSIKIHLKTPSQPGKYQLSLFLTRRQSQIELLKKQVIIIPPSLSLNLQLGWRVNNSADGVKILVYNNDEKIVYEFANQKLEHGHLDLDRLFNIVPGQEHRVVGIVPFYLPEQRIVRFNSGENIIDLPRFIPLDFNQDGQLSLADYVASFKLSPTSLRKLVF
jgi:hypothetical protein